MVEDLWGEIPSPENIATPTVILREQAALISQKTGGLITGKVATSASGQRPEVALWLVVPNMNGYSYKLVTVSTDPVSIYPALVMAAYQNSYTQVANEDAFKALLAAIFRSHQTITVLTGLQLQARAVEQKS